MSRFIFSIGIPRSGKSTYLKNLSKSIENCIILSGDSFRYAITGERFNLNSELHVRASLVAAARALLLDGYNVILDETNTSEYNQKQLLDLHESPEIILIHSPIYVCVERAIECNQRDLIPSIHRMQENLEKFYQKVKENRHDKRINKDNTTEIGPIFYHLFTKDEYRKN